jgi:hypothetical protein
MPHTVQMFFYIQEFPFEQRSVGEGFESDIGHSAFLVVARRKNVSDVLELVFNGRDISGHGYLFVPTEWILHGNPRELCFR